MTNIWMLSKDSMRGMDLLAISTDVLYAIEQLERGDGELPEKELREMFQRGFRL